jgi:IS1 family transposase
MHCPKCRSDKKVKNGKVFTTQRYKCKDSGCSYTQPHKNELLRLLRRHRIIQVATDGFNVYKHIKSSAHVVGKKYTTQIESLNANVILLLFYYTKRHYLYCFSNSQITVS